MPNPNPKTAQLVPHQFKTGDQWRGNPGGRPKSIFTRADVDRMFQEYLNLPPGDLIELTKGIKPDGSKAVTIEIMVAGAVLKVAAKADIEQVAKALELAVGAMPKAAAPEDDDKSKQNETLAGIPKTTLIELVKQGKTK